MEAAANVSITVDDKKEDVPVNTEENADFVIDRTGVPLAYCAEPEVHKKPEKSNEPDAKTLSKVFDEMAGVYHDIENVTTVRKAESVKSFGCDTESEFGFSGDDSDYDDHCKDFGKDAADSDEEFDRFLKYSSKLIRKIHEVSEPNSDRKPKKGNKSKVDNVHEYDNLPPIENLTIECKSSLIEFGQITKIVDCVVVVEPTSTEVLDFDSFLFDVNAKALGQIYDIFGQVKNPNYAIRFNSKEEADMHPIGMKVYYAPNEEQFSKTPFKGLNLAAANQEHIRKLNKQLDASSAQEKLKNRPVIEGVDSDVEFSDDEAEKEYRQKMKKVSINSGNFTNRKRDRRGENVRFADQSKPHQNRNQGRWNWHNTNAPRPYRRDFDGAPPASVPVTPVETGMDTTPAPSAPVAAPNSLPTEQPQTNSNPYAEFGCYGGFTGRFGI